MNSLPTDTQFRLLKKAIPECVVMAKVWGFNVKSKEEELSLVFTERDLQQFKVNDMKNITMINKIWIF